MTPFPDSNTEHPCSWTLIRDVAVLQVKLLVDGARDLLLVPATLIAGILSLATSQDGKPGTQFYRLVGIGKQSERWINLFGAFDNAPPELVEQNHFGDTDTQINLTRAENLQLVDDAFGLQVTSSSIRTNSRALFAIVSTRESSVPARDRTV